MRWTAECYRWQEALLALEDSVAESGEDGCGGREGRR